MYVPSLEEEPGLAGPDQRTLRAHPDTSSASPPCGSALRWAAGGTAARGGAARLCCRPASRAAFPAPLLFAFPLPHPYTAVPSLPLLQQEPAAVLMLLPASLIAPTTPGPLPQPMQPMFFNMRYRKMGLFQALYFIWFMGCFIHALRVSSVFFPPNC